jgi:hypothetical protein
LEVVHNVYVQVVGFKRFVLFPASEHFKLYSFTTLHPSVRQTQVDFNDDRNWSRFPKFLQAEAFEVVLAPGDVLYIPPFMYHAVSVVTPPSSNVTDAISVSVSIHTSCKEVEVRAKL